MKQFIDSYNVQPHDRDKMIALSARMGTRSRMVLKVAQYEVLYQRMRNGDIRIIPLPQSDVWLTSRIDMYAPAGTDQFVDVYTGLFPVTVLDSGRSVTVPVLVDDSAPPQHPTEFNSSSLTRHTGRSPFRVRVRSVYTVEGATHVVIDAVRLDSRIRHTASVVWPTNITYTPPATPTAPAFTGTCFYVGKDMCVLLCGGSTSYVVMNLTTLMAHRVADTVLDGLTGSVVLVGLLASNDKVAVLGVSVNNVVDRITAVATSSPVATESMVSTPSATNSLKVTVVVSEGGILIQKDTGHSTQGYTHYTAVDNNGGIKTGVKSSLRTDSNFQTYLRPTLGTYSHGSTRQATFYMDGASSLQELTRQTGLWVTVPIQGPAGEFRCLNLFQADYSFPSGENCSIREVRTTGEDSPSVSGFPWSYQYWWRMDSSASVQFYVAHELFSLVGVEFSTGAQAVNTYYICVVSPNVAMTTILNWNQPGVDAPQLVVLTKTEDALICAVATKAFTGLGPAVGSTQYSICRITATAAPAELLRMPSRVGTAPLETARYSKDSKIIYICAVEERAAVKYQTTYAIDTGNSDAVTTFPEEVVTGVQTLSVYESGGRAHYLEQQRIDGGVSGGIIYMRERY